MALNCSNADRLGMKMGINVMTTVCLVLLGTSILGRVQAQTDLIRGDSGRVHFTSDAPLELIQAQSKALKGIIDPIEQTFAFSVEISTFQGFNSPLQRTHFNENYMESTHFPTASYSGKIIEDINWSEPGAYEIRTKGILSVHGVEKERIIRSNIQILDDQVRVSSNFTVPIMEHEISIPKIVVQKISEVIVVDIQIHLQRQNPQR